jgi:hypothetical protein
MYDYYLIVKKVSILFLISACSFGTDGIMKAIGKLTPKTTKQEDENK